MVEDILTSRGGITNGGIYGGGSRGALNALAVLTALTGCVSRHDTQRQSKELRLDGADDA